MTLDVRTVENRPPPSDTGGTKVHPLNSAKQSGYHLTHRIKRQMQDANVIIMTGRHKDECLELVASRLVDGWLFKPFGLNELRDMIRLFGLLKD